MDNSTSQCSSSADIISIFRKYDETGHGTIRREVLESVISSLGFRRMEFLQQVPSYSDTEILYAEFVQWVFRENNKSCASYANLERLDKISPPFQLTPSSGEHLKMLNDSFPFQGYIANTEHRGISLRQLQLVLEFVSGACSAWYDVTPPGSFETSGKALSMDIINLYHINTWLILPATQADKCSFVELLSVGGCPQIPNWFVSHWWGEAASSFLKCLSLHSITRELGEHTIYWVCAYANRQHSLDQELVADPLQTSFYKAMQLAQQQGGVLLVLDERTSLGFGPATPFKRIWCAFEESMALKLHISLDIAACQGSSAHLLTDGVTRQDEREQIKFQAGGAARAKAEREKCFPIEVIRSGLTLQMENAEATRLEDKVRILNCLTGASDLDGIPASTHPVYDQLNTQLRATFAVAAWRQAVEKGLVEDLCLSERLHADAHRDSLVMDFTYCLGFDDADLSRLAQGLPPKLKSLDLCFAYCRKLNDSSVAALAGTFPPSLLELSLKFGSCPKIGEESLKALAPRLRGLRHLRLDFSDCRLIGDDGLRALAAGFPASIKLLELRFSRCSLVSDAGLAALAQGLPPGIRLLDLQFDRCKRIGDEGLCELARALPACLSSLSLSFTGCSCGDAGLTSLVESLPPGASVCAFRFCGTGASDTLLHRCEGLLASQEVGPGKEELVRACPAYEVCGMQYKELQIGQTNFYVKACMQFVRVLGQGCFGTTVMFRDTETGKCYAIKKFADAFSDLSAAKRMLREIKLQVFLHHENISGIVDIYPPDAIDFDVVYTVQAYMDTDLHGVIRSQQVLHTEHIQYFLYQILRGLRCLHSAGVAHCDIKPSTLLVNQSCDLCISDFGNARSVATFENGGAEGNEDYVVTRWYQSPERMLSVHSFATAMDIWSAGCILGEMFLREPLFQGNGYSAQLATILRVLGSPSASQLEWLPAESTLLTLLAAKEPFPKRPWSSLLNGASAEAHHILDVMLTFDPRARADATQCLGHSFLVTLHDASDEPLASVGFDWSFQRVNPSRRSLQNGIYIEALRLHPELLERDNKVLTELGIVSELSCPSVANRNDNCK